MFYICKEKCFCASQAGEDYAKGTLLYCFGEVLFLNELTNIKTEFVQVVIPKSDIRDEDSLSTKISEDIESYYLQMAQLALVLFMILSV